MTGSLRHAPAGTLPDDPYRRAVVTAGRRIGPRLPRRPPVRDVAPARARRARAVPRRAARAASRSTRAFRAARPRRAPREAARAGQGGDPRSAHASPASGTSTPTRRSGAPASTRCREARDLDAREMRALHRQIRRALELGIARQGATLRDYALPDGEPPAGCRTSSRSTAGRRAVRALRHADRADPWSRAAGTWYCPAASRAARPGACPTAALDLAGWPGGLQDRGGRPALDALLRGRPDPAPLHARARPDRRDREGGPEDEVALRRAARAALARRARCCTRARASCRR